MAQHWLTFDMDGIHMNPSTLPEVIVEVGSIAPGISMF